MESEVTRQLQNFYPEAELKEMNQLDIRGLVLGIPPEDLSYRAVLTHNELEIARASADEFKVPNTRTCDGAFRVGQLVNAAAKLLVEGCGETMPDQSNCSGCQGLRLTDSMCTAIATAKRNNDELYGL